MKTIKTLIAAIEGCDINALQASLAADFAFQQDGLPSLDAAAFCDAVAGLHAAATNVALDTGAPHASGPKVVIDVALDVALANDAPSALIDLAQAGGLLVTVPQTWTVALAAGHIEAITAEPVEGVGVAEALGAIAASPIAV